MDRIEFMGFLADSSRKVQRLQWESDQQQLQHARAEKSIHNQLIESMQKHIDESRKSTRMRKELAESKEKITELNAMLEEMPTESKKTMTVKTKTTERAINKAHIKARRLGAYKGADWYSTHNKARLAINLGAKLYECICGYAVHEWKLTPVHRHVGKRRLRREEPKREIQMRPYHRFAAHESRCSARKGVAVAAPAPAVHDTEKSSSSSSSSSSSMTAMTPKKVKLPRKPAAKAKAKASPATKSPHPDSPLDTAFDSGYESNF
jgi:hypothetical protein